MASIRCCYLALIHWTRLDGRQVWYFVSNFYNSELLNRWLHSRRNNRERFGRRIGNQLENNQKKVNEL